MLDSTSQREDAAYHEAGHVVVGYLMGWWLNDEGAEIDRRQYTGLRCYTFQNDTRRSVIVKLAGWLAEHQFHKCGDAHQVTADGDAAFLLQEARDGVDDLHDGDLWEACQRVLADHPGATDADLLAMLKECEDEAEQLLQKPEVWKSVEAVAGALLARGKVTDIEVRSHALRLRP